MGFTMLSLITLLAAILPKIKNDAVFYMAMCISRALSAICVAIVTPACYSIIVI
jgi:hypothetical protein